MSKKNEYTEEMLSFIKDNIIGTPYNELTATLNQKFSTDYKPKTIAALANRMGLTNYVSRFSEREKEFLFANYPRPYKELAKEVSQIEGKTRTVDQIADFYCRYKISTGRHYGFEKGHKSPVAKPIGHEIKSSRDRVFVKVRDDYRSTLDNLNGCMRNYRLKQDVLWEQYHNQEIPDNHVVIFMDGDKSNFNKDNLACVPASVICRMNALNWQYEDNPLMRGLAIRSSYLDWALKKQGVITK